MILVDTNVLIDIFENDPKWLFWSFKQIENYSQFDRLGINFIIYAELTSVFKTMALLDQNLLQLDLKIEPFPREAAFLAGQAYISYKKRGGLKGKILPDFFIGAHATVLDCPIITRDTNPYRTYFPRLKLISP